MKDKHDNNNNNNKNKIWVLFASQTGNAEHAARSIVAQIPNHITTGSTSQQHWYGEAMSLDDFLEQEGAPFTPVIIICTSSYGVGQAPLGGYRFRELCDYILLQKKSTSSLLSGLHYALLGLGDSKYTTFFQNPTQINAALEAAGATCIAPIGKIDASSTRDQQKCIEEFIANLWEPLNITLESISTDSSTMKKDDVDVKESMMEHRLQEMRSNVIEICQKINPDFVVSNTATTKMSTTNNITMIVFPIIIAFLAVTAYYYYLPQ